MTARSRQISRLLPTILFVAAIVVAVFALKWFEAPRPSVLPDERLQVDDEERSYRVVLSKDLPEGRLPIVYAFHGTGDSPESMAAYSGLDRLAVKEGFVVAYPEARNGMWKTVDLQAETIEENADVRFFDRLHEEMSRRFDVDERRVFVIGMSNGGDFAQVLAAVRPHIAGVVAHSATRPELAEDARRPFPTLLIVGEEDPIAEQVASDAEAYRAAGHDVRTVTTPKLGHAWSPDANAEIKEFLASPAD